MTLGEFLDKHGPGTHPKEPDRFSEGFSMFIASGALVGLWQSGSLKLPRGVVADVFYWLIVTIGVFGFLWLTFGLADRYLGRGDD